MLKSEELREIGSYELSWFHNGFHPKEEVPNKLKRLKNHLRATGYKGPIYVEFTPTHVIFKSTH